MTYFGDNWYPPEPAVPPWPTEPPTQTRSYQRPQPIGAELRALRSAYRLLRRVSTLTALGYFVIYVILSCYAEDLMSARVAGELPVGIALGLLQLAVTFAAVGWYELSARRSVDPWALHVRQLRGRQGMHAGGRR